MFPKRRSNPLRVGIDPGSSRVKVVGLSRSDDDFQLEFMQSCKLHGEPSAPDAYEEIFTDLAEQYPLNKGHINVTLPARQAVIRRIELDANLSHEDKIGVFSERLARDGVEVDRSMRFVFHHFSDNAEHALACALPESVLQRYRDSFSRAGLQVDVFDLDAFALYNSFLRRLSRGAECASGILHIGAGYSMLIVALQPDDPYFFILALGGDALTRRMAEEMNVSFSQAEKSKIQASGNGHNSHEIEAIETLIYGFSKALAKRVKKYFLYFRSRNAVAEIKTLYLSGGGAKLFSLGNLLSEQLAVDIAFWNPLEIIPGMSPDVYGLQGMALTPALGTVLRGA